MDRRQAIGRSLAAVAAAAAAPLLPGQARANLARKRILVLGGTKFLGPQIVDAAIAEGHAVTLFNRGVTHPELYPNLPKLRGFRSADPHDEDFQALAGRRFDVAIDVWPNDPPVVARAAEVLKDRVGHYLYVSSVGAYDARELERAGVTEDAPLEAWTSSARAYNRGKAESERRLHAILGERLTIVRPGPIKGERDDTPDLLTWLIRCQAGGRHIAPGDGGDQLELVDVKDVARFLILAIDAGLYGTFNLTGRAMTFRAFLAACKTAMRSDAEFVWMPRDFLRAQGLETDSALHLFAGNFPFWRPPGTQPGLWEVSSAKAYAAGWRTRPFEETALDCLAAFRAPAGALDWTDYLTPAKEQAVLAAWDAAHPGARRAGA